MLGSDESLLGTDTPLRFPFFIDLVSSGSTGGGSSAESAAAAISSEFRAVSVSISEFLLEQASAVEAADVQILKKFIRCCREFFCVRPMKLRMRLAGKQWTGLVDFLKKLGIDGVLADDAPTVGDATGPAGSIIIPSSADGGTAKFVHAMVASQVG